MPSCSTSSGKRTGARAEVGVDRIPDVVVDSVHDLFGPLRLVHPLAVGRLREHLRFQPAALQLGDVLAPLDLHVVVLRVRPVHGRGGGQDASRLHGEVVGDAGDGERGEDFLGLWPALPADDEGLVIHRHQLLEDLKVARRIVRGRQQAAEDAGLVQDERLAALPVAAQRGERLATAPPSAPCTPRRRASAPAAAAR